MRFFYLLITFFTVNIYSKAQTESNPFINPSAAVDYTDNLKIGDKGIAVDDRSNTKMVKIFQVKNGIYQVGPVDITDWEIKNKPYELKWYKANSVYTYYDIAAFNQKVGTYKSTIEAYMLCFCQKYKFKLEIATGKTEWPTYYIKDATELAEQKQKLDELWKMLEPLGPLPNTFLPYYDNPAIWKLIAKDRVEYIECLSKVANPNATRMVDFYLKEISQAKNVAQNFKGGYDGLYNSNTYDWMFRAVSMKARKEYIAAQNGWNTNSEAVSKINTALDELKPLCIQKIPLLKLPDSYFKYHDAGCETTMKNHLSNPATFKILKIGVTDNEWIIEKNNLGIPLYRYKRGQIWAKNSADDHGFCKMLFFEIRQDYSGGGVYANSKIKGYHEEISGCQ